MTKNQLLEMFPIGPEIRDSRRFDPVTAITAGVSMGGNLLSGFFGKKAANKAGELQAEAARKAGADVVAAEEGTRGAVFDASNAAGENVRTAAAGAATGVLDASQTANALLDPYRVTGEEANAQLRNLMAPGGEFNRAPTLEELQLDPGYQFRLQEGMKLLQQSAAARGGALGGGALKEITTYGQGAASQEFQAAFNRFRQTQADRFGRLDTVAGRGRDVASESGKNLMGASEYAGDVKLGAEKYAGDADMDANRFVAGNTIDAAKTKAGYDTDAAAAIAGGKVGGSNALWSGVAGAGNAGTNALLLRNLLRNPSGTGGLKV